MIINSDRVVYSQSRGFFFFLSLSPRTNRAEANLKVSCAVDGGGRIRWHLSHVTLIFIYLAQLLAYISYLAAPTKCSRSSILRISHLILRGAGSSPSHLCVSLVCMTRAKGVGVWGGWCRSQPERGINHLWKQLCSVAADDSRRGVGARQRARGPLSLPLFIILPGSCGGNGCKGKLVLPLAVHHQKAGSTWGHTDWITGGVDGGSDCQCVCVCVCV